MESKKTIQTWSLGAGVPNQQVGNAWGVDGDIVSLSMSGVFNVFDQRVGDKPTRFLNVRAFKCSLPSYVFTHISLPSYLPSLFELLSFFSLPLIQGPQNPIFASTFTSSGTFLAGTSDGRIYSYDIGDGQDAGKGSAEVVAGEAHNGMVTSVVSAGESIVSVGFDDTLREVSADGKSMTYVSVLY